MASISNSSNLLRPPYGLDSIHVSVCAEIHAAFRLSQGLRDFPTHGHTLPTEAYTQD